jgi:general secretion pathway protein G
MNNRRRHTAERPTARAFTIVEIIVVIVIIGVLATLIAPRLLSRVGKAKSATALSNANTIAQAVNTFVLDTGGVVPGGPGLGFLVERPADVDAAKWNGPYLNNADQLKDPWGNDYILIAPGQKNADFDIVSYGADGKPGGEGDNADVINK